MDSRIRGWRFSFLLWSSLITIFATTSALAQLSTAALNGVVSDSTGAVVRGANVVLRNLDTGIETAIVSNDTGIYRFNNISPGRYSLKVSAPSFTTKQVSGLRQARRQK